MEVYEYAVIRLVPQIEREEFINVGIILFSKHARFIDTKIHLDEKRLNWFQCALDIEQLRANLTAFEKICRGEKDGGPIANEDLASRFRWLTAVRSSVIQTSRPHPGKSNDLRKTLEHLFREYVD